MKIQYANIIVDISHEKVDRSFQYKIPEELQNQIQIGTRVIIPFGRGNRRIAGYVIEITEEPVYELEKTKEILGVESQGITIESKLIALAAWLKQNYGATMNQALKTVLPIKQKMKEKCKRKVCLAVGQQEAVEILSELERKHNKARARLMKALMEDGDLDYDLVVHELRITTSVLKAVEEKGQIRIESTMMYRNPITASREKATKTFLNTEQQQVVKDIEEEWKQEEVRPCLIHGITGSGKTLVYMELMEKVLTSGKQVIVLIPEIALTYQTVRRFYQRFGEKVSVMNSKLSKGERYDQFERAKKNEIQIMIGPRSALFTPFPNLGLIIIDEEHETSYISENVPRYHARDVAIKRGEMENAYVVLGSATPSLDAYYKCQQGKYKLCTMETRYENRQLPKVDIVDLREELKTGNRSIISTCLQEKMQERLNKKEQIMLFLNRRGYLGFVSCRSCGYVAKCPHCDVSLAAHNNGKLICHYCGYETKELHQCPTCGSSYIGGFRAGTQQIEEIVKGLFPTARVLRMDFDTTKGKDGHAKILAAFSNQEADILIGTQMIVKGHDFPNVTLVGVLAADLSLLAQDYRAGERTFQLLTQAVGRAGRGKVPGEAVIQTYHPEHYSIAAAVEQDYQSFYQEEIAYRMLLGYPPIAAMVAIYGASREEEVLEMAMYYLKELIRKICPKKELKVIGPAPLLVSKVQDVYRRVIYLRYEDYRFLIRIKDRLEEYIKINKGFDKVYIQFDFNA